MTFHRTVLFVLAFVLAGASFVHADPASGSLVGTISQLLGGRLSHGNDRRAYLENVRVDAAAFVFQGERPTKLLNEVLQESRKAVAARHGAGSAQSLADYDLAALVLAGTRAAESRP